MIRRSVSFALLPFLAMSASACEKPDSRPADWEVVHAAIIVPSCATSSCHSSIARVAGVVLDDIDNTHELLLNGAAFSSSGYVVPGASSSSTLIHLLEGRQRLQMPPDAPLPEADIDLLRQWIDEGAER